MAIKARKRKEQGTGIPKLIPRDWMKNKGFPQTPEEVEEFLRQFERERDKHRRRRAAERKNTTGIPKKMPKELSVKERLKFLEELELYRLKRSKQRREQKKRKKDRKYPPKKLEDGRLEQEVRSGGMVKRYAKGGGVRKSKR